MQINRQDAVVSSCQLKPETRRCEVAQSPSSRIVLMLTRCTPSSFPSLCVHIYDPFLFLIWEKLVIAITLVPFNVLAFTFTNTNSTECDNLTISWTGKYNLSFFFIY